MTVGEKLQELLDWSGMSQKELSVRAGISASSINGYIKGTRAAPLENLERIADALGVSAWLIVNHESLPPDELELSPGEIKVIGMMRGMPNTERHLAEHNVEALYNLSRRYRIALQQKEQKPE